MYINLSYYTERISLGETLRDICPHCGGGPSKERTFTITMQENGFLVWNCFRDKCPVVGTTQPSVPITDKAVKKLRPTWDGPTTELPVEVRQWIKDKWGIENPEHWYYTGDFGGRIAMSIRSPKGTHRGWLLRSDGSIQPKALTYMNEGEEGLSWYKTNPHAPTVLVEDIPSSVRASTYMNTVALLGTGVGLPRAVELAEFCTRPIYVALDQDALATAFKWARKYSLLWGDVKVLPLKQDLKDMKEADLCNLLTPLCVTPNKN